MELTQKETLPAAFAKNTGWEEVVPEEAETASAGADAVSAEADAEEVGRIQAGKGQYCESVCKENLLWGLRETDAFREGKQRLKR